MKRQYRNNKKKKKKTIRTDMPTIIITHLNNFYWI